MTDKFILPHGFAAADGEAVDGQQVVVNASGFDGNLNQDDVNVQHMAQTIDDLAIDGGGPSGPQVAASNVTVSSAALNGLLDGSGSVQEALERIDATGIGAPITEFAGSYTMTTANRNEWLNRHIQGEDGQSCSRNRVANLPSVAVLNEAFDFLFGGANDGSLRTTVSYLGCSSTSSIVNALRVNPITNVDNAPGGFGFVNNIVLNRADSVTLEISRTGGAVGSWTVSSRGLLPSGSGAVLDDLQFQDRSWANLAGTFLPSSDDVLKGYAFKVIASPDDSGDIRSDLTISSTTEKTMYDGDWVVWTGDTFTNWNDESEWIVIHDEDVRRITRQQSNFLSEVGEQDTDNYIRIADDPAAQTGTEALAWLVNPDTPLTAAPFLEPSGTSSGNTDARFTAGEYVGGRDARQPSGDFVFNLSTLASQAVIYNGELVIGITGAYINANDPADIRLEVRERDGTFVTSYNLSDNFVDPPTFGDLTLDYSILSTFKISDSATQLRYHVGQILSLRINRPNRRFTLSSDVNVGNENIAGGAWGEDALSTPVQAKLNKETSLTAQDRSRLDGIETASGSIPVPGDHQVLVRAALPNFNDNSFHTLRVSDGLTQDFQNTITYTVRVANSVQFTGFDFTGGRTRSGSVTLTEVLPTLYENERTYTLVVPPAPDDITYNPLSHLIVLTGTVTPHEPSGLVPTIKVDADNFEQPFLDSIVNHDTSLPAPLQALNTQASVIHFDNTDFASNNAHSGIEAMFAFLKNRPDERQGDTPPTTTTLTNEITNSEITATIASLNGLFYPRDIAGSFDNGVEQTTQGALTGPGSVNEPITITSPSDSNFRLTLGFWFDSDQIPDNTIRNLIRVRERGQTSSRRLFGIEGSTRINEQNRVETGILITERVQGAAGTSVQVPVTHHLYTTLGEILHVFSGVGAAETLFRVNEAREYTISAALAANGNSEGTDTVTVTVADINQDQDFGTHDFVYTVAGQHNHIQQARIEYVASGSTYGGPGHTLRFELLNGLADNSNFDIDHLTVSAGYVTQETITTPTSYAEANAGGTPLIKSRKKHRMIFSFSQNASNNNLECIYAVTGFDDSSAPVLWRSSVVNFGYPPFDLDWSQILLGNTNMYIAQNIQGFFSNTGTPNDQLPTSSQLADWLMSHDEKATDYVWDNAAAPSRNVEVVRFPEHVNMPNLTFEDTENTDRFTLSIVNGVLTPVKIV